MTTTVLRLFVTFVVTLAIAACGGDDSSTTTASQEAVATKATSAPAEVRRESLAATASEAATTALWQECETNPDEFLAWARSAYPEYFSGRMSNYVDYSAGGVLYTRVSYAREKNNYLAVSDADKNVFAYGDYTGYNLVNLGPMAARACDVKKAGFGDKRIMVVHLKFLDTGADPFPITETIARTEKVKQFYAEASYGKSIQTYEVKPWATLPETGASYMARDPTGWSLQMEASSYVASRYDLSQTDIVVLIFTPLSNGLPGCWEGQQRLDFPGGVQRTMSIVYLSGHEIGCGKNAGLMAHEIGHAYGLPFGDVAVHTSAFLCEQPNWLPASLVTPTWSAVDCGHPFAQGEVWFLPYTNFDVMGSFNAHPSSFWKVFFGWLNPSQVVTIESKGMVVLSPLETASPQVKAAKIPVGFDQKGEPVTYWIEYRTPGVIELETGEEKLSDWAPDKVKVWINLENVPIESVHNNSWYIYQSTLFTFGENPSKKSQMELGVGESFLDPFRGMKVTRGSNVSGNATVTVEVSTLKVDPPVGAEISAGSSQTITVTNGGTAAIQNGTIVREGETPTSFRIISDSCGGKPLGAGRSCTIIVKYAPAAGVTVPQFAHLKWTTNDPIRKTPSVGLQGIPAN